MWGMIENRRMRFALIDQAKNDFASLGKVPPALSSPALKRLCNVLGVSQSGYFAYCGRNASARQRDDMVMVAHVRSAFSLSNGTYGSPRCQTCADSVNLSA